MGYTTRFSLALDFIVGGKVAKLVDDSPLNAVISSLREVNENARYALDDEGNPEDSAKWYEHEADMRAFSQQHPSVLFTLHGEGEENEDVWNKYFLNGKCQVAKAVMQVAKFDPNELR